MNRFFTAFTGSIISLMIVSCSGETVDYSEPLVTPPAVTDLPDVTPPDSPSAPLSSIKPEAVADCNEFSLKFYLANSEGTHGNLCVSPFSVGAVLGMLANGDDGDSRNSILKLMGFEESDTGLEALNMYYQTMLSNLPNIEEGISCNVTNTLWYDPSRYLMRKTFLDRMTDYYYACGIGMHPGGETGMTAINEFVAKNTNGLIKDFLKTPLQIDLAFLNTLYFKAGWNAGFVGLEEKGRFLDIDGKVQATDFMCRTDYTEYGVADDGTEAIRLNYGEKKQFSMTCILPSSLINHIALDEVMTTANLLAINKSMRKEYMRVELPKFEIETNNDNTIGVLKSLGLICGKFSLIVDSSDFFLDTFIHATKINVDENGTEGAAASLGGTLTVGGPSEGNSIIPKIVFDRPFIFYIRENTTGAILFIGAVKTFS